MGRKKILVVDDEPDVNAYFHMLLDDHGYKVFQARSAKEAFAIMEMSMPDLICLDIMMPKKSGIAFYQEFKLDDRYKDLPTIFISAFSLARDFYGEGFRKLISDQRVPEPQAYLEKPVQVDKLLEVIKETIG